MRVHVSMLVQKEGTKMDKRVPCILAFSLATCVILAADGCLRVSAGDSIG